MNVTQQAVQTQLHGLLQELSSLPSPVKDTVNAKDSPTPGFRLRSVCFLCRNWASVVPERHFFLKITWVIREFSYFPKTGSVVSANDYVFSWLHGSEQKMQCWIQSVSREKKLIDMQQALNSVSQRIQDLAKQWVYFGQEVEASKDFPVEDMFWFTQALFHPGKAPKEAFNPFAPDTPLCPAWQNTWTPVEEEQEPFGEGEGFHLYSSSNCVFMGSAAFLNVMFKKSRFIVPRVFSEDAQNKRKEAKKKATLEAEKEKEKAKEREAGEEEQELKRRYKIQNRGWRERRDWDNFFAQTDTEKVFVSMVLCYTFSRIKKENISEFQVNARLLGKKKRFFKEKKWEKQIWVNILDNKVMMDPMPMTAACLQTVSLRRMILSIICNYLEKFCGRHLFSKELANRCFAIEKLLKVYYENLFWLERSDYEKQPKDVEHTKFIESVSNFIAKIHSVEDFHQKGVNLLFPKAKLGSLYDLQPQIAEREKLPACL